MAVRGLVKLRIVGRGWVSQTRRMLGKFGGGCEIFGDVRRDREMKVDVEEVGLLW
jgi:hypothetical protein